MCVLKLEPSTAPHRPGATGDALFCSDEKLNTTPDDTSLFSFIYLRSPTGRLNQTGTRIHPLLSHNPCAIASLISATAVAPLSCSSLILCFLRKVPGRKRKILPRWHLKCHPPVSILVICHAMVSLPDPRDLLARICCASCQRAWRDSGAAMWCSLLVLMGIYWPLWTHVENGRFLLAWF